MAASTAKAAWKLNPALREIRLHLCQKSPASKGVRTFVESHYVPLKVENPKFPILVRECSGINPKLYGRFAYGREVMVDLSNRTSDQVLEAIKTLE